jgi:hypothetical protein
MRHNPRDFGIDDSEVEPIKSALSCCHWEDECAFDRMIQLSRLLGARANGRHLIRKRTSMKMSSHGIL